MAIELAASRSQSLSPAEIADQLAQPLSIGRHALRDLPERQQSLQATIRWSYELLGAAARKVLRSAAVFLGGFTVGALEAVAGAACAEQLEEVHNANLVRRQPRGDRWELLELVRVFALQELEAGGQTAETRARHRRFFAALIAPTREAPEQGGMPGELATPLLPDHANLRTALEDAIEAGGMAVNTRTWRR